MPGFQEHENQAQELARQRRKLLRQICQEKKKRKIRLQNRLWQKKEGGGGGVGAEKISGKASCRERGGRTRHARNVFVVRVWSHWLEYGFGALMSLLAASVRRLTFDV